jgi:hypothetical protein
MILDKNLPRGVCFVGLVQRFVVFSSNNKGFTLIFMKIQRILKLPLKRVPVSSFWHLFLDPY